MRFEEALKAMREGKRVKRFAYDFPAIYWFDFNKKTISLQVIDVYSGNEILDYIDETCFAYEDINADDWEIADD